MGTWGTGIFDDDISSDVKASFEELLAEGLTAPLARQAMTEEWAEAIEDPEDGPIFWLALAAAQWELGRLELSVKSRALAIIRSGKDLLRWTEPGDREARSGILADLAKRLSGRQPPRKKITVSKKKFLSFTAMKAGDLFAYRLDSGRWMLMRVSRIRGDLSRDYVYVQALDWIKEAPPDETAAKSVPDRMQTFLSKTPEPMRLMLYEKRHGDYPEARVRVVGRAGKYSTETQNSWLVAWSELAAKLSEAGLT